MTGSFSSWSKEQVRDIALGEMKVPFELAAAPLMRATLLQGRNMDNLLLLTPHHIIIDGWSIRLLVHDLALAYNAVCQAQLPPQFQELTRQYTDFSVWQRQQLTSGAWQHQLDFWREELQVNPCWRLIAQAWLIPGLFALLHMAWLPGLSSQ